MGEGAFQLINAALFAITVAIAPAKQTGTGIVAQAGVQDGQQVAVSAPVAAEDELTQK